MLGWLLMVVVPSQAQNAQDNFSGRFSLGVRGVDVDGSQRKYSQDVNLDDGPRLFDLGFVFSPGEEFNNLVDLIEMDVSNLGGDPFEAIHLGIRKYGCVQFQIRSAQVRVLLR